MMAARNSLATGRRWTALVLLFSGVALAEPPQDCAVPSHLPNGPVSKATADCAIQHAHFLYANRCKARSAACGSSRRIKGGCGDAHLLAKIYVGIGVGQEEYIGQD